MTLTADLVSEFVKTTKDTKKQKDNNVYGTTVDYGGVIYVKIDGSDLLTPVETTTSMKAGERVIVKIKDHKATVTGNITSPSVSEGEIKDVKNEIIKVKSEFTTSLTEFKSTISATYVTNEDFTNSTNSISTSVSELKQDYDVFKISVNKTYIDLQTDISEISQTADKINFIVKSGDSSTNMVLTEDFYNVVSDNIKLSADSISLEGLTTVNENFKILTDGTCEAFDLVITNTVSTNELIAKRINVPWISTSLTRDISVHINPEHIYNNENYNLETETIFKTFSDLLKICPANLNGYKLKIYLDADVTENISLLGLNNGGIEINLKGYSIKGHIYGNQRTCIYDIYGNDSDNVGSGVMGKIIPGVVGYLYNGTRYSVCIEKALIIMHDVDIYSGTSTDYNNHGVTLSLGAEGYLSNIRAVNNPNSLVRCQNSSHCYVESSSGTSSYATFQSMSGSIMQLKNGNQAGRSDSTVYTYVSDNGKIFSDGVKWDQTIIIDSDIINDNTDTSTIITKTINSDYGDSYRYRYTSWRNDNTVRQGQYGYGMNKGLWFFGDEIYDILNSSNEILELTLTIKRQSGGISAANTHYLRAHTYSITPSGEPTFLSTDIFSPTFSVATGKSINITLTTEQINSLKTNGAKGFGIYTTSTNTGLYSVCSGSCTVTIKYRTNN